MQRGAGLSQVSSGPKDVLPTLLVRKKRELFGFCFTPQDGNSLLSSIAATLWLIEPDWKSVERRLEWTKRWLYKEI